MYSVYLSILAFVFGGMSYCTIMVFCANVSEHSVHTQLTFVNNTNKNLVTTAKGATWKSYRGRMGRLSNRCVSLLPCRPKAGHISPSVRPVNVQ